ncbi:tyrosine-type recombinase/integrase [Geothrix fuzhouensis]|uniref:tyrosine-type recombinase/integrase n=1 Tax=Geothrix fuzhouensis TaxID=2966451 RepID=UPI002147615D
MSLEELHAKAAEVRKMKAEKDPMEERNRLREEARKAKAAATEEAVRIAEGKSKAPTMADACKLYATYAADRANVKASTEAWTNALIKRVILPYWSDRLVADVTRAEVKDWHRSDAMREHPSQADAALRVLSKIFNLALEEAPPWRTDNPAYKLKKQVTGAAKVRERILSQAERKALERTMRAMEAEKAEKETDPQSKKTGIDPAAAGAIRALLLSAMRLQECLTLRWDEIEWDEPTTDPESGEVQEAITGWIKKEEHKSSRRSGAKLVAITPQLGKILRAQATRAGSPWVFPSPITPEPGEELGHFIGLQKVWERIRERLTKDEAELVKAKKKKKAEALNIEDVHLHDLRRTALSVTYGDEGQTLEALAEVAGHASTVTTKKHYAHLERHKKRIAAEKIAAKMGEAMEAE